MTTDRIESLTDLRSRFGEVSERARLKQIDHLDRHCRDFIALSPFLVLATGAPGGPLDASPRGGAPGFVKAPDAHTLLIPDAPGNNRLDTLENLLALPKIGLIFLIPGFEETLRVNGDAVLSTAADDIALATSERRAPKLVIRVAVREAYLHCAKAFMRSKLWEPGSQVPRDRLPSVARMISDQAGLALPREETQEEMRRRYEPDL